MAKSLFEPKRVPKYTDNIIKPATGLQAAPTPPRQRSAARPVPKTQAVPASAQQVSAPAPAPVAAPAPTPTPAPVVVEETRAFSFDGSTELTGSYTTAGGSKLERGTLAFTARPGWSQTETGSFTVFSINNPSDNTDYKRSIEFQRTSGSNGYQDKIVLKTSKGSDSYVNTWTNPLTPNFYSGSTDFTFYEVYFNGNNIGQVRIKRAPYYPSSPDIKSTYAVTGTSQGRKLVPKTLLNGTDYEMTVGGLNSGSDHRYKGEISNISLGKGLAVFVGTSMPRVVEDNTNIDIVYKFEGNLLASKGNKDLGVVGTETYVSSSI